MRVFKCVALTVLGLVLGAVSTFIVVMILLGLGVLGVKTPGPLGALGEDVLTVSIAIVLFGIGGCVGLRSGRRGMCERQR